MRSEPRVTLHEGRVGAGALRLWVAGGGFGDLSYFGEAAQAVGAANPATYALDAVRYAYFGGVADPTLLIVLAVGAAATLAAVCAIYARWTRSERAASRTSSYGN